MYRLGFPVFVSIFQIKSAIFYHTFTNTQRMKLYYPILFLCGLFLTFSCTEEASDSETVSEEQVIPGDTTVYNIPKGFKIEKLYYPSSHEQGTWVAIAEGPNKTLFACDQRGDIYQFEMPGPDAVIDSVNVDSVDLNIGYAHGMLWAFNSLYVAVNRRWPSPEDIEEEPEKKDINGSGIYRLTDTDGDNKLDKMEMLLQLDGAGEHGPHNFLLGPDGKELYFIAGNHVLVPDALAQNSRVPNVWGEDNLFPAFPDARGHATEIKAPGGWIAKSTDQGSTWELYSAGYRNPFDFAFNGDGELFAFDADMEWDFGMPWYRPIRICHVTSGSSYGWRTGSGKWPVYYPDNLSPVVNIGQGSPTMLLSGQNLNFPAKYKEGLFAFDWSFGTVYFVGLQNNGSSYIGTKEEFFSGVPLPLTSAIAGSDGNLYFATGGRDLESNLYRLSYTGTETAAPKLTRYEDAENLRSLRKSLEAYHNKQDAAAIPLAWEHLKHPDRFVRFAARVALEHQPVKDWQDKIKTETDSDRIIQAALALARHGDKSLQAGIIDKLSSINNEELTKSKKLDLLRAYNLLFIRMGKPNSSQSTAFIEAWNQHFPSNDYAIDREISQLLVFVEDPLAVEKCLNLLEKHMKERTVTHPELLSEEVSSRSERYGPAIQDMLKKMPPTEATYYGTLLSHATAGWTESLRERYFLWFARVLDAKGGMSYKPFIENIRKQAMTNVPEDRKKYFEELSGVYTPEAIMASLPQPKGPGKEYYIGHISWKVKNELKEYSGDIAQGKLVYEAAYCGVCHRMQGEGGNMGPDLTQLHTRFKLNEMINAVFSPSEEISDQYAFTLFHLKDGKYMAGRILSEKDGKVTIMPNPYSSTITTEIAVDEIKRRELSAASPMPPGLLNRLNEEEVIDLFAYLMAGGDKEHYYYGGEKGKKEEEEK